MQRVGSNLRLAVAVALLAVVCLRTVAASTCMCVCYTGSYCSEELHLMTVSTCDSDSCTASACEAAYSECSNSYQCTESTTASCGWSILDSIDATTLAVVWAILLLPALLNLLAGYRTFQLTLFIVGYVLGAIIGVVTLRATGQSDVVTYLCAFLLFGPAIGILALFCFFVGIFLIGFLLGLMLCSLIYYFALPSPPTGTVSLVIMLVIAVVFGSVAVCLVKQLVIIATALIGSVLIWMIILLAETEEATIAYTVLVAVTAIFGIFVQCKYTSQNFSHSDARAAGVAGSLTYVVVVVKKPGKLFSKETNESVPLMNDANYARYEA